MCKGGTCLRILVRLKLKFAETSTRFNNCKATIAAHVTLCIVAQRSTKRFAASAFCAALFGGQLFFWFLVDGQKSAAYYLSGLLLSDCFFVLSVISKTRIASLCMKAASCSIS